MQLVLMSLKPDEDIPEETHANTTQFIRVEEGTASVIVNDRKNKLLPGDSIIIPPGTKHYVKNISESDLKLYTIYSPPEHKEGLTQKVKV
jgi:mannose-6-phosphate isomerase-like protein (cupin superfamily)